LLKNVYIFQKEGMNRVEDRILYRGHFKEEDIMNKAPPSGGSPLGVRPGSAATSGAGKLAEAGVTVSSSSGKKIMARVVTGVAGGGDTGIATTPPLSN